MKIDWDKCPVCDGKIIGRCRCLMGERICKNAHTTWVYHKHNHFVIGRYDHGDGDGSDTCEGQETIDFKGQ